jgi:TP901 family phage tail tape measure protein
MSDLDVALRLRLVNQLSRPAEEAERDLQQLGRAAQQLGRTRVGAELGTGLQQLGRDAEAAQGKLGSITKEANEARQALGRIGDGASGIRADAQRAEQAIRGIRTEAQAARQALGRIDDGAFDGLKADANAAEKAIKDIGAAADAQRAKLATLRMGGPLNGSGYGPVRPGLTGGGAGGGTGIAGAAYDRLGGDAFIPLTAGAGYAVGGAFASAGIIAGHSITAAAGDEFISDSIRITGGYSEADQARYDRLMAQIGARKGVGTAGAMNVMGQLLAGGINPEEAAAMTEQTIVFGKATGSTSEDAAKATIALRNNFGIGSDDLMGAQDIMALGGKAGQFEVKDMAMHVPSIAAKMATLGESGLPGTKVLVALGQQIRKATGTSAEAATNFEGMLGKFTAQDFLKNASEYGIDVQKTLSAAQEAGTSPVMAVLEEIYSKVGTDPFKLKALMPEEQAGAGLAAVVQNLQAAKDLMKDMDAAPGTVMEDFAIATDNASAAWDRFSANVAAKAKSLAANTLPLLTEAMNALSAAMEGGTNEPSALKAPPGSSGALQQEMHARTDNAHRANRFFEQLLGWEPSEASKRLDVIDAYQEYGRTRAEGERYSVEDYEAGQARDAARKRRETMWGVGGSPLSGDLRPEAEASMRGYVEGLASEGAVAEQEAASIADRIKALLGFTVSPTIAPTYVAPGSSGGSDAAPATAGERHSSLQSSQNLRVTQNITSPNPSHAAAKARREQARAVNRSFARAQHDLARVPT